MNEFFFKFRYGIKVYKNVLTDSERKILVESSKKYLRKISSDHPGLQSLNYLDRLFKINQDKDAFFLIDKLIKRSKLNNLKMQDCWVNYTDLNRKYTCWHVHENIKKSLVYYLDSPENLGTIFRVGCKECQISGMENSMIVFNSDIEHTVPYNISLPRLSLAMDFV
jgi:hypothetical protein|tara:strand:+ start:306 stop:803 length:498 start_codon:yes stop_codon:yes gene_type:complete